MWKNKTNHNYFKMYVSGEVINKLSRAMTPKIPNVSSVLNQPIRPHARTLQIMSDNL